MRRSEIVIVKHGGGNIMRLGCLYANVEEDFTVNVSVFTVFSQKTEDESWMGHPR